ncbi:MAG: glycosyltransferase family 2 protein [Leptolyngbya sp. SIO4C1]|nr:glycosyltransferase family 2 protein [Leptolyngbya sp. SIO4C1]
MTAVIQNQSAYAGQSVSISLILPVRNRQDFTAAILQQLAQQGAEQTDSQVAAIQVVVVDDGSSDGTADLIRHRFPWVHLLQGDGSLWWTGAIATGMNYAVQQLSADYLVWLNDDIAIADDFIPQLIAQCQRTSPDQKVITGGIIREVTHPDWIVFGGVIASQQINDICQFADRSILKVDTLNGNIAVMPAQIVSDVGLPDTERFRHYGGDYEYVCRAKAAGYQVQLSRLLQATTAYTPADVKRYMPLWIQWYVSSTLADKWSVLQNLTSRKSPHNVEHMVNSIYRSVPHVPRWKYVAFYVRKLIKILGSMLVPTAIRRDRIDAYLKHHRVPADVAQGLLKQRESFTS